MDDAAPVRLFERAADLLEDGDRAIRRHGAALLERVGEALSLEELHHDVEDAFGRGPEVVDLDGVRVLKLGDGADLALEARLDLGVARQMGMERLHRDLAGRSSRAACSPS